MISATSCLKLVISQALPDFPCLGRHSPDPDQPQHFLIDIDPVTLDYWQRLKTARKCSDSCAAVARLLLVAIGFQKYLGELAPLLVRGWSTPVLNGRGNPHSRAWGAHALV